jgi:Protein of unknown function (DUF4236)
MGFYIRKSVSVGPFRFNLSKSGIGVSTGIKGFRVGSGPRGNYVQMGRGGIYFRQTLPPTNNRNAPSIIQNDKPSSINFAEIESAGVNQMADSSSAALLQEINSKSKKARIWPWVLVLGICLLIALEIADSPTWAFYFAVPFWIGGLFLAFYADKVRKTVVLFYELEPQIEQAYKNLHDVFDSLRACSRVWHIQSSGKITTTYDWKVNAGASTLVKRQAIKPDGVSPSYFQCNISIAVLPAGRQRLYFLPDRILVRDTDGFGAIGYEQLDVNYAERRFIENETVPNDSRVLDKTWRYVNKKGGPDRRFSNNREIPIVLYEEILLASRSGLQELFQASKTGIGIHLKAAVEHMATVISQ